MGTGVGGAQLAAMREANPNAKALVFTQFNQTLEWLKARLQQRGHAFRTICGSMSMHEQSEVPEPTANLTKATRDTTWSAVKIDSVDHPRACAHIVLVDKVTRLTSAAPWKQESRV